MILFQNNFNKMKAEILFYFDLWKITLFQHTYYVLVLGFILKKIVYAVIDQQRNFNQN